MPFVNCRICSKDFYAKPSWIKNGKGKYCSAKCSALSKMKGTIVKCFTCNREVYKSLKDLKNSKSKNYFCSKKCSLKWNTSLHTGADSPNWRGGKSSYKKILSRDKIEKVCTLCRKDNPRILSVHHLNLDRNSNDVKNLVWLCQNCHFLVHHYDLEKQKLFKIHASQ